MVGQSALDGRSGARASGRNCIGHNYNHTGALGHAFWAITVLAITILALASGGDALKTSVWTGALGVLKACIIIIYYYL